MYGVHVQLATGHRMEVISEPGAFRSALFSVIDEMSLVNPRLSSWLATGQCSCIELELHSFNTYGLFDSTSLDPS